MPTHPPHTDSELLALLQQKDERAYKILFDRYYVDLCRQAAFKLNGDCDAAEEVVQQVFIAFWVEEKYRVVTENVKGYLSKMVHHKAVSYIREQVRLRGNRDKMGSNEPRSLNEIEIREEARAAEELLKTLHVEIAGLPEQCRLVFEQVYFNERRYQDVADEMGITINTVKYQMKIAMAKLRARMAAGGNNGNNLIILIFVSFLPTLIQYLNDC